MFNDAKNFRLDIGGKTMDCISFGRGEKALILIPGVGDGLKTVEGTAFPFSVMYRKLAKRYRVYAFSRINNLPDGYTTRDMAKDTSAAMDALGIKSAYIVGVSQGGMIAQYLAIDHPEKVEKLILCVTLSRPNGVVTDVVNRWIEMAKKSDYAGIMMDTAERSYSEKYLKKARAMYGLVSKMGKPDSFERFIIQARSCITHDAYDELSAISCPTLIIGGSEDKIVSPEASLEINERIKGSELKMYDGLGHGTYEEAKDFLDRIISFCG